MSKIQEKSASPKNPKSLSIVSMNLAGCEPSAEAPDTWNQTYAAEVVRQELLRKDPDILALQECPGRDVWAEQLFAGYKVMDVGTAHAGYVLLLVRNALAPYAEPVLLPRNLPAVMARITSGGVSLNVASCHLAPFAGGANRRRTQIQALLDATNNNPLVIAGDTNMRQEEDHVMEGTFQLRDAWKEAGEDPATKFTWDTENHIEEGGFFNRYYGHNTREYKTRYDRIYISDPALKVAVKSFELVANRPVNPSSKTHFLSDHFGIACELQLGEQP